MTETIQQVKENIAILQEKLQKLEELQRTKSPAEEAFRKVYYRYPDKLDDKYGSAWDIFEKGYNAANVSETPQGPEQTEKSLKEAFVKAQQTEEWKETQRKIDGKNPPKFLKFELGQSLTDLIYDWWEDVFAKNSNDDMENCIGRLVYWIEEWLPKEQNSSGSQNAYVECSVEGFNDCINKIRRKLR